MTRSSGLILAAMKMIFYGIQGVGKSTKASKFPKPLFLDIEGSTWRINVSRESKPSSWMMLLEQINEFLRNPDGHLTLVIDTLDWAERLCIEHICAIRNIKNLGGANDWGATYSALYLEWGKFLDKLTEVVERGYHVVLVSHGTVKKYDIPEELGTAYDRWMLALSNNSCAEKAADWAENIIFASYETHTVAIDGSNKTKAQGHNRVMYAEYRPAWLAKNRFGWPAKMTLDDTRIEDEAHAFSRTRWPEGSTPAPAPQPIQQTAPAPAPADQFPYEAQKPAPAPAPAPETPPAPAPQAAPAQPAMVPPANPELDGGVPQALADLMQQSGVTGAELRMAVSPKYYPVDAPIRNYAPDFVQGKLIANWPTVVKRINTLKGATA